MIRKKKFTSTTTPHLLYLIDRLLPLASQFTAEQEARAAGAWFGWILSFKLEQHQSHLVISNKTDPYTPHQPNRTWEKKGRKKTLINPPTNLFAEEIIHSIHPT